MSGTKRKIVKEAVNEILDTYNKQEMKGINGLVGIGLLILFLTASKIQNCTNPSPDSNNHELIETNNKNITSKNINFNPAHIADPNPKIILIQKQILGLPGDTIKSKIIIDTLNR